MSNIIIEVKFLPGINIKESIKETIEKCKEWNVAVIRFEFNGVNLFVNSNSLLQDVYSEYQLKQSRKQ